MKNICVYCGSNFGDRASYRQAAEAMGKLLAQRNIGLVYGGGDVGLMGVVADAAIDAGGEVTGVIPKLLADKEVAHQRLTDLRIVNTMHERKHIMAELSDAFIAMPGGFGTLEELFEVVTWTQLSFHNKACGVLNVEGYYDGLLTFLDHATAEKFIRPHHREIVVVETEPAALLEKLNKFEHADVQKWTNEGSA